MQMFNDSLPDCFPPVALSRPVGSGEIVLVTTPLLFTNYGMLDGDNAAYLFRLLSHLKGLPVVRTEAYGVGAQVEVSPFSLLPFPASSEVGALPDDAGIGALYGIYRPQKAKGYSGDS